MVREILPALRAAGACEDGSCWLWPSITQSSYQTAELLAEQLGLGRNRIVPEYRYRGGVWCRPAGHLEEPHRTGVQMRGCGPDGVRVPECRPIMFPECMRVPSNAMTSSSSSCPFPPCSFLAKRGLGALEDLPLPLTCPLTSPPPFLCSFLDKRGLGALEDLPLDRAREQVAQGDAQDARWRPVPGRVLGGGDGGGGGPCLVVVGWMDAKRGEDGPHLVTACRTCLPVHPCAVCNTCPPKQVARPMSRGPPHQSGCSPPPSPV